MGADEGHVLDVRRLHLRRARRRAVFQQHHIVVERQRVVAGGADAVRRGGADEHDGAHAQAAKHQVQLRGEERGEKKAKKATAISLAEMGLPVEQIARGVKESVSIVQAWITEGMTVVK